MSKETKDNMIGFVVMAVLAMLMAYIAVRDLDKDTEKVCGYEVQDGKPAWCMDWWKDKGVINANAESNSAQ
jgi:hypothetical protein